MNNEMLFKFRRNIGVSSRLPSKKDEVLNAPVLYRFKKITEEEQNKAENEMKSKGSRYIPQDLGKDYMELVCKNNFEDIAIADEEGNILYPTKECIVEEFDEEKQKLCVWVPVKGIPKEPKMKNIYVYYGVEY